MKRRLFIQAVTPVTLALLPSLPEGQGNADQISDEAFERELRRRFENLPTFLKRETCKFDLAAAVLMLSLKNPKIELVENKGK